MFNLCSSTWPKSQLRADWAMQRREAGDAIAKEIVRRYGCAVDIAYHEPSKTGDQRNFHAHILFTQRSFDPERADGWARNKYDALRHDREDKATGKLYLDWRGEPTTRGTLEVEDLRKFTAGAFNQIAERDRLEVRSEYLSFERRGIDREPTQKRGPLADKMEREGKNSRIGERNREIVAANDNRDRLREDAKIIDLEERRVRRELAKLDRAELTNLLASKHRHYDYHREQVQEAENALTESKARLQHITFLQWATGKRGEYEADIAAKEKTLANAQERMAELVSQKDMERFEQGRSKSVSLNVTAGEIRAQKAAEYALARDQHQKDQKELQALENALESRTKADRVIGAVTGRTKAQQARLDELRAAVRSFEQREELAQSYREERSRETEEAAERKQDHERKAEQARNDAAHAIEDNVISHEFEENAHEHEEFVERAREEFNRLDRQRQERGEGRDGFDRDID